MGKTTVYNVGDKVQIRAGKEHDTMTKDKKGTIIEISTPALGIKFDGMRGTHKWYSDNEVKAQNPQKMPPPKPKK